VEQDEEGDPNPEWLIPKFDRVSVKVSAIPEVAGGAVSAVVQPRHPAFPVYATHEVIWTGSEAAGGRRRACGGCSRCGNSRRGSWEASGGIRSR
jgi:hypothetical protein